MNVSCCPLCSFLISQHTFMFDFRGILCFKLQKSLDGLVLINNKPCSGSTDIDRNNKTLLEFLLAIN